VRVINFRIIIIIKMRHMTYRLLRLVHPFFVQLTLLPNPNILCFTTFFNLPHTPKVPLPVRASYIPM